MALFMLGCASSGFVVLLIQSAILVVLDVKDVTRNSFIYFGICALVLITILILFLNMLKYPIIAEKLAPLTTDQVKRETKLRGNYRKSLRTKFKTAFVKKLGFTYHEIYGDVFGCTITL